MRRYLMVLPFLFACSKAETPSVDSTAAAMPPALTEADVAGKWSGNLMMEGSDSVIGTWSNQCGGGMCTLVGSAAPTDTVHVTYTLAGDSSMYTAAAHKDPQTKAMVTESGVARVAGGQMTGSGMVRLADKPDSVVMRYRFTGTKQP